MNHRQRTVLEVLQALSLEISLMMAAMVEKLTVGRFRPIPRLVTRTYAT